MLYRLSQNLCQNSAKTVRKTQHEQLLVNHVVRSLRFVPNNTDYTEIHSEIYYNSYLNFYANKCCMTALECMPILSEIVVVVLLNFFTHYMLYDLHKSVWYGLFFLAVWNPYFSLLWDVFSPSANAVSFLSSTSLLLSLVLSTRMLELLLFSQQECLNLPKNGCALLPKSTSWGKVRGFLI